MAAKSMISVRPGQKQARSSASAKVASFHVDQATAKEARKRAQPAAGQKTIKPIGQARAEVLGQSAKRLSSAEQNALVVRIRAGDQAAREALILANLGLVANIAKRYYSYGATLDDLIQEGSRGLIRAVDRYDPQTTSARFSTYATYWIRNMIRRSVVANYSLVRLPEYLFRRNLRKHQRKAGPQIETAAKLDDRGPTAAESPLSALPRRRRHRDEALMKRFTYRELDHRGDLDHRTETPPGAGHPEHDLEIVERHEKLHEALAQLTALEAWLIRRRFEIGDSHDGSPLAAQAHSEPTSVREDDSRRLSRTQRAGALKISVHRLRQIEQVALGKLRDSLVCSLALPEFS
jgi:RNA polymerase sigma factor (sigma-70 family)